MSGLNTRVFKEPLGFIRVIELPLAILAFATTAGYSATTIITAQCGTGTDTENTQSHWGYPFDLTSVTVPADVCAKPPGGQQERLFSIGAYSQSQFFVFIGVIAFLYILAILGVYLVLWPKYENDGRLPLADFVFTAIWALFWFIGSCAWASGLNTVKYVTDKQHIQDYISEPTKGLVPCRNSSVTPAPTPAPAPLCGVNGSWNYASLNVSVITGFACFGLWLANLWFIYKETPWYKARAAITTPQAGPGVGTSAGPTGSPFR